MSLHRAYSVLTIKAIDPGTRIVTGTASTPRPDRMGDVVEPSGAKFARDIPLLLYHDSRRPVGTATLKKSADGITFEAHIPEIAEPGTLRDRVQEAWGSLTSRPPLIRGTSIGFRPLKDGIEALDDGGLRFTKTEILELSLVTVPANSDAVITEATIKSYDTDHPAASGTGDRSKARQSAGVAARVTGTARKGAAGMKKPIADQIIEFKDARQAKIDERNGIMETAAEKGETLDADQSTKYDDLKSEIKALDDHIARLEELESEQKAAAKDVQGTTAKQAADSRTTQVIRVKDTVPPGIGFARAVMCKAAAFLHNSNGSGEYTSALQIAKQRYPSHEALHLQLKGAIGAGASTHADYSALVDPANLASEFIEFLRPMTIIGKFGTEGVPSLRRIPFNVRVIGQSAGGRGYWVGQGAPKPLTAQEFSPTTLTWAKVAAISVITDELARFSSPSAEMLVRDSLAADIVERIDTDFVDPAVAASANVSPASITNGLTPLATAGTSADNARTDIQNLLEAFILANINPANVVLIMPNTLALALSMLRNSLGQPEFTGLTMNGGRLEGLPVITSQYAANQSGFGNMVIAVKADEVFLSDDGQVTVDVSREASLEMLDNPTNNSATATATSMVSMWQTNSIALRAERYINWAVRRSTAVVYMDDVNWGSIGSPS